MVDMKLSQKRSCGKCKAYPYDTFDRRCQLGVAIEPTTIVHGKILNFKPMDLCYKPKTYAQLFEAYEIIKGTEHGRKTLS